MSKVAAECRRSWKGMCRRPALARTGWKWCRRKTLGARRAYRSAVRRWSQPGWALLINPIIASAFLIIYAVLL